MSRKFFLGSPIDALTMDESVDLIKRRIASGVFTQHVVVNVAKVVNMHTDKQLHDSVTACDIINVDGMGVVWGARLLGLDIPERVTGVDLFQRLLKMSAEEGFPVYLLGGSDDVILKTVSESKRLYPQLKVVGYHHGYFWDNESAVVEEIRASGAKLLFVAISSPMKENFINRWREQLGITFVMGVGGTFDVVAGKVRRAPLWMQRWGLEWLFRLAQEPGRMWKRYLSTNSKFAWILLKEMLFGQKNHGGRKN